MALKNISFEKYQGAGNDFIIIDGRDSKLHNPHFVARGLCDRHFSIGADDVLYIERSNIATVRMRVLEPDGSESNMCGNGIRSVALYLFKKEGLSDVSIETLGGVKRVIKKENEFTADMGKMQTIGKFMLPKSNSIIEELDFDGEKYYIVSSSEPHAVNFVNKVDEININGAIAVSKDFNVFPKGINVDFVEISEKNLRVRTFERGIWGETLACGTGAVASSFVAKKLFGLDNHFVVEMKGGTLYVDFINEEAFLTGPAEFVFKGYIMVED
jgi:diaminopimelate epimerase